MTPTDFSQTPDITLTQLSEQIERWRQTRKSRRPMPEQLWQAAAELSKQSSINKVSKALGLNYTALKKRVYPQDKPVNAPAPSPFIELGFEHQAAPVAECIVEMEDGCGAKMKMHFRGKTDLDLVQLGKAFWTKER
jgi:hypothetical protein